ncbi:MAG: hypothetical protein HDR23_02045 [Lachnospiraceae bacterium]|nr:hypothetical protein [Lachnospiraceae bacterium]
MNALEKDHLFTETNMQIKALRKISEWKRIAMLISAIGVAVAYAGIAGSPSRPFLGILGILLTFVGVAAAVIMNLGLKNGRRNVEKMINLMEKGRKS